MQKKGGQGGQREDVLLTFTQEKNINTETYWILRDSIVTKEFEKIVTFIKKKLTSETYNILKGQYPENIFSNYL